DRADIDDPAIFAGVHAVPHRLGHVEASAQVDVDHLVPGIAIHPLHRAVAGDAGIVDQDVHRPELGLDPRDAIDAGVEIGDVPLVGGDAGPLGEGARPVIIAGIIGGDGDAGVLQRDADRLAD